MSLGLYYLEINAISLIILAILFNNERKKLGKTAEQRSFNLIIVSVIAIVIFDSIMWAVSGQDFIGAKTIHWISACFYYLLNCFVPFTWFFYVVVYCNLYQRYFKTNRKYILFLPLLINTLLTCINYFTHWIFYINDRNIYIRGSLFIMTVILGFSYLVMATFVVVRRYRKETFIEEKSKMKTMLMFMVLPAAGAIAQMWIFGASLVWIGATLALLMVFVNIQNSQITTDLLTGLNNRYQFNRYLGKAFVNDEERENDGLILIDVNNFKSINDSYGHLVGDEALIIVSTILKKCCNKHKSFLARYGGDEFIVVCNDYDHQELIYLINDKMNEFNDTTSKKFKLTLSIGYAAFKDKSINTVDELIAKADKEMYANKKINREQMKLDLK